MDHIIFLDCDGVLNNAVTSEVVKATGFIGADNHNLLQLYRLVNLTGAQIVLSSTWQNDSGMLKYLKKKMKRYQLEIIDTTHEHDIFRGATIKGYIEAHGIMHYVILDDYHFEDFDTMGLLPHFVQTDYYKGLTTDDVRKAVEVLKIT